MKAWRIAAIAALGVALAACGTRPPPALTPVAADPRASEQPLLVMTMRRPSSDPAVLFSGERTLTPRFAALSVSIPPDRQPGEVNWSRATPPDPAQSFAVTSAAVLDQATFQTRLRQRIRATGRGHVLVFVHGYNTRFDEAAFRFAQIVHDSAAPVTPVLFSWSSWGSLAAYPYDRISAGLARDGLEELLNRLSRDPAVTQVSVLAHSMGGWLTMEAVRQMAIRHGATHPKLRDVMLASPDIDVDTAAEQGRALGPRRPRFSLFVSRDDEALSVSRFIWGSRDQLGAIDPNQEPYRTNLARFGVEVFDLTEVRSGDPLRHAKFAQSPDVVRAIGARLAAGQRLANQEGDIAGSAGLLTQGAITGIGRVLTAPLTVGQEGPSHGAVAAP